MNKEQHKKLTFDDMLARKLQREKDKMRIMSIYIPSMDGELVFNSLPEYKLLEIMDGVEYGGLIISFEKSKELIYTSCKDLQNPELHKMLEIVDPIDVISTLFTIDEVNNIGAELLKFNGIGQSENKIIASIKN